MLVFVMVVDWLHGWIWLAACLCCVLSVCWLGLSVSVWMVCFTDAACEWLSCIVLCVWCLWFGCACWLILRLAGIACLVLDAAVCCLFVVGAPLLCCVLC